MKKERYIIISLPKYLYWELVHPSIAVYFSFYFIKFLTECRLFIVNLCMWVCELASVSVMSMRTHQKQNIFISHIIHYQVVNVETLKIWTHWPDNVFKNGYNFIFSHIDQDQSVLCTITGHCVQCPTLLDIVHNDRLLCTMSNLPHWP